MLSHIVITEEERVEAGPDRLAGPRTLDRAFSVLDCFTSGTSRWRTTRLAERCGLPVPTVHRILAVFESWGYVARDPDSLEYRLGPTAAGVGHRAGMATVPGAVLKVMRSLRSRTGEGVVLAFARGPSEWRFELPAGSAGEPGPVERTVSLPSGATGMVLLAYLPDDLRSPALAGTDPELTRRRGWALAPEEQPPDHWAVAAPVFDRHRRIVCALGVTAPRSRLARPLVRCCLDLLSAAAEELERTLAVRPAGGEEAVPV